MDKQNADLGLQLYLALNARGAYVLRDKPFQNFAENCNGIIHFYA